MSSAMASLQGLPPLPKSLSALLNFSSSQWKELERLHAMRTMIQQDLSRGSSTTERIVPQQVPQQLFSEPEQSTTPPEQTPLQSVEPLTPGSANNPERRPSAKSRLDAQLALLRKEMVGLRQLDMSLLCQLWSLNESIQEYKHILQDRMMVASASSPGWDNGLLMDYSDDTFDNMRQSDFHLERPRPRRGRGQRGDLSSVPERLSSDSSSSDHSSFEFGDI